MPFNVTTDPQWKVFKTVLVNTPKSVSEVEVNVKWNELKRWKLYTGDSVSMFACPQLHPADISNQDDELVKGTQVHSVNVLMSHSTYSIVGPH